MFCINTPTGVTNDSQHLEPNASYGTKMSSDGAPRQKFAISHNTVSWFSCNLLKPTGYFTYHQVEHFKILHRDNMEFVCYVWISEQTANFAFHNINCLVFITNVESVYCAVQTESLCDTFRLMFVPCIIRRSRNNQHYALNCTTLLFKIQAPTCFGSSLPSSESFLDSSELFQMQTE
jgi:hypothetical protein